MKWRYRECVGVVDGMWRVIHFVCLVVQKIQKPPCTCKATFYLFFLVLWLVGELLTTVVNQRAFDTYQVSLWSRSVCVCVIKWVMVYVGNEWRHLRSRCVLEPEWKTKLGFNWIRMMMENNTNRRNNEMRRWARRRKRNYTPRMVPRSWWKRTAPVLLIGYASESPIWQRLTQSTVMSKWLLKRPLGAKGGPEWYRGEREKECMDISMRAMVASVGEWSSQVLHERTVSF